MAPEEMRRRAPLVGESGEEENVASGSGFVFVNIVPSAPMAVGKMGNLLMKLHPEVFAARDRFHIGEDDEISNFILVVANDHRCQVPTVIGNIMDQGRLGECGHCRLLSNHVAKKVSGLRHGLHLLEEQILEFLILCLELCNELIMAYGHGHGSLSVRQ